MTVARDGTKPQARRRSDPKLLVWFAMVLALVYFVVLGGSWFGIYFSPLRITSVSLAAVAIASWIFVARRSHSWRPSSFLMPAIGAALGSLAISTVFSRSPRISLEYLGYSIVLAALYLLFVRLLADPFFRRRLVSLAALLFVGLSGIYLALVFAHWLQWWSVVGRVAVPPLRPEFEGLTYGNPSAVLTLVALLAVPTAANLGTPTRWRWAAWAAIAADVAVIALLSGSRAGWLAIGLTVVIVPVVGLTDQRRRAAVAAVVRRRTQGSAARALVVLAAVLIVASGVLLAPALAGRLGAGGEGLRAEYAIIAFRIFASSPLVGTGPGTWVIQRPGETLAGENDYYIPHAHNLEVQTLAELGIAGAVAGIFLFSSIGRLLRNGARDPDPSRRLWAWLGGIGLLYFVLHQLLDFYPGIPGILFAAVIPVAYLDATANRRSADQPASMQRGGARTSGTVAIASLAIVAVAVGGLLLQEIPALQMERAVDAADRGDWAVADAPARAAAAEDPDVAAYDLAAGLAAAHLGDHTAAVGYFAAVVARSDLPEAWLNLAAEQWQLGRAVDASASLTRAMRLGSQRPAVSMPAGNLALQMGNEALALTAFEEAVASVPSLAGDPWWSGAPQSGIAKQVFEQAIAVGPLDSRWEVALMSGQTDRARTLAGSLADPREALEFIEAWAGTPNGVDTILADCGAHPLDMILIEWCGRISRRDGNTARGNDFGYLAETLSGGAYPYSAELRVNTGTPVGRIEGIPASLWGTYTYRRTTPMDILVPSLLHLRSA